MYTRAGECGIGGKKEKMFINSRRASKMPPNGAKPKTASRWWDTAAVLSSLSTQLQFIGTPRVRPDSPCLERDTNYVGQSLL